MIKKQRKIWGPLKKLILLTAGAATIFALKYYEDKSFLDKFNYQPNGLETIVTKEQETPTKISSKTIIEKDGTEVKYVVDYRDLTSREETQDILKKESIKPKQEKTILLVEKNNQDSIRNRYKTKHDFPQYSKEKIKDNYEKAIDKIVLNITEKRRNLKEKDILNDPKFALSTPKTDYKKRELERVIKDLKKSIPTSPQEIMGYSNSKPLAKTVNTSGMPKDNYSIQVYTKPNFFGVKNNDLQDRRSRSISIKPEEFNNKTITQVYPGETPSSVYAGVHIKNNNKTINKEVPIGDRNSSTKNLVKNLVQKQIDLQGDYVVNGRLVYKKDKKDLYAILAGEAFTATTEDMDIVLLSAINRTDKKYMNKSLHDVLYEKINPHAYAYSCINGGGNSPYREAIGKSKFPKFKYNKETKRNEINWKYTEHEKLKTYINEFLNRKGQTSFLYADKIIAYHDNSITYKQIVEKELKKIDEYSKKGEKYNPFWLNLVEVARTSNFHAYAYKNDIPKVSYTISDSLGKTNLNNKVFEALSKKTGLSKNDLIQQNYFLNIKGIKPGDKVSAYSVRNYTRG
jgi:hypothetical protein